MRAFWILVAALSVVSFSEAAAEIVQVDGDTMIVELTVEIEEVEAVVAHLVLPGENQLTIPLLVRSPGVFGTVTEIRKADYSVVFEAPGSGVPLSHPALLSELGAVFETPQDSTETEADDGLSSATQKQGWLALALVAAALSALAFWVLGDSETSRPEDGEGSGISDEEE